MSEDTIEKGRQRFFKTMVLMGSSLALGCGGMVNEAAAGAGAGGQSALGGTGGTGTSMGGSTSAEGGSGGSSVGGTGGSSAGTGGVAGTGGAVSATCPPDQWVCDPIPQCESSYGYSLPTYCRCDETRPLSGDDCASGRRVCLTATAEADGTQLDEAIPFACTCASDPTSCSDSCRDAYTDGDGHWCFTDIYPTTGRVPVPPGSDDLLCGCSFVYLR